MPRILIVDDNPGDRRLAQVYLKEIENLDIDFADDGEAALRDLTEHLPDVVLTDLRMPRVNGIELVTQVHQRHPHIPIILMTSHGSEQIAVNALTAGASSYVSKDNLDTQLADTVRRVIGVAQARTRRRSVNQCLKAAELHYILDNDPMLVPALIGCLQENIERLEFGDDTDRTRVGIALQEALDNALYHGNLEVSSALKDDNRDEYYRLAQERRRQQPYASRRIHVTVRESREEVAYVIRDEGPGYNPGALPDPTLPENMLKASGRGLLLIRSFMDRVEHNEKGNEVTLVKRNSVNGAR